MTTARDQLYLDIFTTAMEGGIGYWALARSYHWLHNDGQPGVQPVEDVLGFYADIAECDDGGDTTERHRIDRAVIARGYTLATGEWRNRLPWSTEPPPLVITDDTDWDFDAGDADTIVQLGLGLIDTIRAGDRAGEQCVRYG